MSLIHRLKREIKASPAKAAGLGALLVVAGYFWLPLLSGFLPQGKNTPPAPTATSSNTTASTATPAPSPTPKVNAKDGVPENYDWRTFADQIEHDAKMHSTTGLPDEHDPFARPAPAEPATTESEAPPVVIEPLTPQDAGLTLYTTLSGAGRQIAEINGKSYTLGDEVEVDEDGDLASFRVVDIRPRQVVLESDGKRYELTIPRPLVDAAAESRTADRGAGEKVPHVRTSDPPGERGATGS